MGVFNDYRTRSTIIKFMFSGGFCGDVGTVVLWLLLLYRICRSIAAAEDPGTASVSWSCVWKAICFWFWVAVK